MEEEMNNWDYYINGIMHLILLAYAVGIYHYVFEYKNLWSTASKLDMFFIVFPAIFTILVLVLDVFKFHFDTVDWSKASVNIFDDKEEVDEDD